MVREPSVSDKLSVSSTAGTLARRGDLLLDRRAEEDVIAVNERSGLAGGWQALTHLRSLPRRGA
jgi:hypothetical protein